MKVFRYTIKDLNLPEGRQIIYSFVTTVEKKLIIEESIEKDTLSAVEKSH